MPRLNLDTPDRRMRALWAVLLAGVAPPGGHVYVGRPIRGFVILGLGIAAGIQWVHVVPRSLNQSHAYALVGCFLVLALILDAGFLARKTPDELPRRPLHRWWVYVLFVVGTQIVMPDLLWRLLKSKAGIARQTDRSMESTVLDTERIVFERKPARELAVRDALVVLETEDESLIVRRVAGVPGETIAVERGDVLVDGRYWLEDRMRLRHRADLALEPTLVPPRHVLVLGDRRRQGDPVQGLIAFDRLRGRASWILVPPGFPRDPQYGVRLGEQLR